MDFLNTITAASEKNPGLNYYSYSPKLKALLSQLGSKASYLTQYPSGMSAGERQATINQMVDKIRAGEKPDIEAMRLRMARQGLLGSGIEETERQGIQRGTNEAVAGAKRDVTITDAQQRAAQQIAAMQAAGGIGTQLMAGEQGTESANAARRAEGRASTQDMLSYLQLLYGSQYQSIQPYAQAILAQGQGGNSGTDLSFLAYLPYLMNR